MNWLEVTTAFKKAREELSQADHIADDMAKLLIGRLRAQVNRYSCKALKRELRDFDMRTSTWRNRG